MPARPCRRSGSCSPCGAEDLPRRQEPPRASRAWNADKESDADDHHASTAEGDPQIWAALRKPPASPGEQCSPKAQRQGAPLREHRSPRAWRQGAPFGDHRSPTPRRQGAPLREHRSPTTWHPAALFRERCSLFLRHRSGPSREHRSLFPRGLAALIGERCSRIPWSRGALIREQRSRLPRGLGLFLWRPEVPWRPGILRGLAVLWGERCSRKLGRWGALIRERCSLGVEGGALNCERCSWEGWVAGRGCCRASGSPPHPASKSIVTCRGQD